MVRSCVTVVAPSVRDIVVVRERTVVIAHVDGKRAVVKPTRDTVDGTSVYEWRIDGVVLARVCVRAAEHRRESDRADRKVRGERVRAGDRESRESAVHADQRL